LFHTGLRVLEFVGLTVRDIDFENMVLHVTHQLQRKRNKRIKEKLKGLSPVQYKTKSIEVA